MGDNFTGFVWSITITLIVVFVASFLLIVLRGAPYVRSRRVFLKRAFKLIPKQAFGGALFDIGSGSGIVLREAVEAGFASAIGYELNPLLVVYSKLKLRKYIIQNKIEIKTRDFLLSQSPSGVTIFYCFGYDKFMERAATKIQLYADSEQRKIYLISLAFQLENRQAVASDGLYFLYEFHPCKNVET